MLEKMHKNNQNPESQVSALTYLLTSNGFSIECGGESWNWGWILEEALSIIIKGYINKMLEKMHNNNA